MKTIKTLLAVCLLATATTVSAQSANGTSTAVGSGSYSRFYVSYNPLTLKPDYNGAKNTTLTGFTFGYTKGFSVSKSLPLFVEVGARLNYAFKKENGEGGFFGGDWDDDDWYDDDWYSRPLESGYYDYDDEDEKIETKHTYMGLTVPVNIAYKWSPASLPISITPFVGITLKGNILSKSKTTYGDEEEKWNNFDKKDVGKDGQWKRFQAGWQIGVGVDYKQLYVGFHYGSDFGEVCKKVNTSNWGISVGYNF